MNGVPGHRMDAGPLRASSVLDCFTGTDACPDNAAHGPAYGKDSMEGKLPGENRDRLVRGSAGPQAAAAQQRRGRATISVDLRRLAARLASLNPGESGITELSGPFINLPDNILSLVHWTQPSPEFLALAD